MVENRLKTDRILLCWLLLTAIWNIVSQLVGSSYLCSVSYILFILYWMWSLRDEIRDKYVKIRLELGGALLVLLFVLRILRWAAFPSESLGSRLCWYAYYIAILITPLLSLSLSLTIGRHDMRKHRRLLIPFWIVCITMLLLILTNDLHSLVLKIWYENGRDFNEAQPLFYLYIVWYLGMMIASFVILLYKCRIAAAKRYLWVPVLVEGFGILLWMIYYVVKGGSSPRINGISLFNIQEVFLLMFLGLWESSIAIGLIPTRSLIKEREWIREGVLKTVDGELAEIRGIFSDLPLRADDGSGFRNSLIRAACLGAYVKRRANLELIADERGVLNTTELSLAIRESFDYYSLAGISVEYEETGNADVPAPLMIAAYELFQSVIECSGCTACYVRVQSSRMQNFVGFRMVIEADPEPEKRVLDVVQAGWIRKELLDLYGASVAVSEQDETMRLELHAEVSVQRGPLASIRFSRAMDAEDSRGLSGLTGFLSLEQEALAEKIRIHDNLGRSLLMTRSYLERPGEVNREDLFREWERSLNEMSYKGQSVSSFDDGGIDEECIRQAKALGVTARLNGVLPTDDRFREIFDTAITVHITNVRKHTNGNTVYIHTEKRDNGWSMTLTDNGDHVIGDRGTEEMHAQDDHSGGESPAEIRETGGLKNLRSQVEAVGGTMDVTGTPRFTLTITLPESRQI